MKTAGHLKTVLLLSLLATFPPLSTDMYLPALPFLQKAWQQPMSIMNLTLVVFFVTYCLSLVVYGPLSDRFGRRKPLLIGIAMYIVASMFCAFSGNIYSLIIFRILQAAGAASGSVISMAITKTFMKGMSVRDYWGTWGHHGPGPDACSCSWGMDHDIFFLAVDFCLPGRYWPYRMGRRFFMEESLKELSVHGVRATAGMYLQLLRNRRYLGVVVLFLLLFSLTFPSSDPQLIFISIHSAPQNRYLDTSLLLTLLQLWPVHLPLPACINGLKAENCSQ